MNEALEKGWIETTDFAGFSQSSSVMRMPGLSPETIDRCRAAAYRQFYFNPHHLVPDTAHVRMAGIKKLILCSRPISALGKMSSDGRGRGSGSGFWLLASGFWLLAKQ